MMARAILAVVLMIGFYSLALGIAFGLLRFAYAMSTSMDHVPVRLVLVCLFGGLTVLWSIAPRLDRFEAPGPVLDPTAQPRLFAEIANIARATGQVPPAEVYLVPDMNAWVAQRGGFMGIGSRRVMGLGLPLIRVLTRSEFRAVLAHEFGHYHAGDTSLGPWIHKTRSAIGRTVQSLAAQGSLLQLPFLWYGQLYLRVTLAVSRRQEFVADALASSIAGSAPLASGLRKVHGSGAVFGAFWSGECLPVLNAGFRPPIAEGFATFLQAGSIANTVEEHLRESLETGHRTPYDSHPPLRERLEAVAALPPGDLPQEDPSAIQFLDNVPELEGALLITLAGPECARKIQPLSWDEVGQRVYLPSWALLVKANASILSGMTPESLPRIASDIEGFSARVVGPDGSPPTSDIRPALADAVIGAALSIHLVRRGALIETRPGDPIVLRHPSTTLAPFSLLGELAAQKIPEQEWQATLDRLGIRGLDLSAVPDDPHPDTVQG